MSSPYKPYKLTTGLFQVICGLAIAVALVAMFQRSSDSYLGPVSDEVRTAGAFALFFSALGLFVVASGIQILIGIEENTRTLAATLARATATGSLSNRAPAAAPALVFEPVSRAEPSISSGEIAPTGTAVRSCRKCGAAAAPTASSVLNAVGDLFGDWLCLRQLSSYQSGGGQVLRKMRGSGIASAAIMSLVRQSAGAWGAILLVLRKTPWT